MTILHVAYLFDCEQFRAEAAPLVQEADSGDSGPVRERALEVIDRMRRDNREWLLADPASNPLFDISHWSLPFRPNQIGYCFLVVLSTYLRPSPASLLGDWPILHAGLTKVGWTERDATLITRGQYTEVLLHSKRVADPLLRPALRGDPAKDDYAWWVRSGNGDTGWLDERQVVQLLERLLPLRGELARLEPHRLRRDVYPTTGPYASMERLLAAYDRAVAMLAAGARSDSGLFMVVS